MKTGYSLLLRQYLDAGEVGYQDCRDFQIVCPACREAIFKAGSEDGLRQYLSHYPAAAAQAPDCELRVARIDATRIDRENAAGRGQQLAAFQAVFREAMLAQIWPDPEMRRQGAAHAAWMAERRTFRWFADQVREMYVRTKDAIDAVFWDLGDVYPGQSPFWRKRQSAFARDFLEHLIARHSVKNLNLALAVGLMHQLAVSERQGAGSTPQDVLGLEAMTALRQAPEDELNRWLERRLQDATMPVVLTAGLQAIRAVLVEFPYVEVLRDALAAKHP